ncbi:hypothetical protein LTR28_008121, partial [Elasticomyces elasticus]
TKENFVGENKREMQGKARQGGYDAVGQDRRGQDRNIAVTRKEPRTTHSTNRSSLLRDL